MTAAVSILSQRERELAAIIASYNDVTEKLKASHERLSHEVRRLHQQLDEKNRELARKERLAALGEMAAGVAHEIRNPLAGIQLFAGLLNRDLADRPKLRELAAKISKGVGSLDSIVTAILAFASPGEITFGPVNLSVILGDVLEFAEPRRESTGGTIHVDASQFKVVVRGNTTQLQRALLNLVFNALDAAGAGGSVWLTCTGDADGVVRITVADDGPGVPPALAQRVFDPFFTSKDSGTGLGLAIVHRIAEDHDGGISVSDRAGGGAAFTLTLRTDQIRNKEAS
jgi:signal transduction histidine kinase